MTQKSYTPVPGHPRIAIIPGLRSGSPCIRGMRICVHDVLQLLAAGETTDDILEDFPTLEPEDIPACLNWASAITIAAARHGLQPAD